MKTKDKKKIQFNLANENINYFLTLLQTRFEPNFDKYYIKQIKKISQAFNIRLKKSDKLKFCKNCETYLDNKTRDIRVNSQFQSKEYICKNCGFVRRYKL